MATEWHIDAAARSSRKPGVPATMHHEADAVLWRPRDEEIEAIERAKAARMVVRMALGRHSCPRLAACGPHDQDECDCTPCTSPDHADDLALAGEALQAFGLVDGSRRTHLRCSTCHLAKALSKFSVRAVTCKDCLAAKKAAREAS